MGWRKSVVTQDVWLRASQAVHEDKEKKRKKNRDALTMVGRAVGRVPTTMDD